MIKYLPYCVLLLLFCACDQPYRKINDREMEELAVQDTLVSNAKWMVLQAGESPQDKFPQLLVKTLQSDKCYLFNYDCELENSLTIRHYTLELILGPEEKRRKNGIWMYAEFYTEGTFPFQNKGTRFAVDSMPKSWNKKNPTREGMYYFEGNELKLFSEQSDKKFNEARKSGFYFIPNNGKLFDRIYLNGLD
ncbi:hypothetical protein [Flavobacterium sp.]|uniref:hypothetical protein n=1 Tax=Flavobacterium sp. TaxID=239 RepID=UPI0039E26C58